MLLAYNPNCSKYAPTDCVAAFYDINGTGDSIYNGANGITDMGVFNAELTNKQLPVGTCSLAEGSKYLFVCDEGVDVEEYYESHQPELNQICNIANPGNDCVLYQGLNPDGSFAPLILRCTCIAIGTPITLADGSHKAIENISYDDDLLVWDFDNGRMSSAKPAWIKQAEVTDKYNLLTFSDGTQLKTIDQHRIFNKDLGKFTYPMTDETPLGTTTLLADRREVQLVDKKVVYEPVEYYNLITEYHFNCFASNVLTSNRFNNLYPIVDFKFVKDNRELTPYSEYENFVSRDWYERLRLAEQTCDEEMKLYLSFRVMTNKKELALV